MSTRVLVGDAATRLTELPDASVRCVVTSPPYFGLRDYRVEGQIGLEASFREYVERLVEVFREVRRVLADDGTLWLNLGDSYAGSWGAQSKRETPGSISRNSVTNQPKVARRGSAVKADGLKAKDLMGVPWRIAFALQDDGWYLRQDIIWHKPNPMPESVRDRCTKAHEYLFLLSKSPRYYFDQGAIREEAEFDGPNSPQSIKSPYGQGLTRRARALPQPAGWATHEGAHGSYHRDGREQGQRVKRSGNKERKPRPGTPAHNPANQCGSVPWEGSTRNKRSVWTVSTRPYTEAHFATFPSKLIEPCILAGSAPGDVILDPFAGSGTTGYVADYLQRDSILIELNPAYVPMIRARLEYAGLFADMEVA